LNGNSGFHQIDRSTDGASHDSRFTGKRTPLADFFIILLVRMRPVAESAQAVCVLGAVMGEQ
jgi:hypothetical protein